MDVDGVLANHVEHVLPPLKREFGIQATFEQIKEWDFPVGNTTFGNILRAKQRSPEFILSTPLVPGATEAMQNLFGAHHIVIVTARPPEASRATQQWLAMHNIPYDTFANLSEGNKHRTIVPSDVLIDDYKTNILEFLCNSQGRAILFSQPWNWDHSGLEEYIASKRLRIASNWSEVVELLETMLDEVLEANDGS